MRALFHGGPLDGEQWPILSKAWPELNPSRIHEETFYDLDFIEKLEGPDGELLEIAHYSVRWPDRNPV